MLWEPGLLYGNWGHYAKAAEYHEKSLAIARKIGDGTV